MTRALLWDIWRRGRRGLLLLTGGLTLFAALVLSVIPVEEAAHRAELGRGLLWISVICTAIGLIYVAEGRAGEGFDRRLFVLPVSSARLATTWLSALAGTNVVVYLAGALALRLWLGSDGPDLAPALFVGALMAWFVWIVWATPQRPVVRSLFTVGAAGLFAGPLALSARSDSLGNPLAALEQAGPGGLAAMVLALVAAFPLATWAVARHRRGDAMPEKSGGKGDPQSVSTKIADRGFDSPFRALLWLDRREKGYFLPVLFGAPWILALLAEATGSMDRETIRALVAAQVGFALFFGPVLAAGVVCRVQDGNLCARLDDLRVLRPVSSATLARTYLTHGAVHLSIAWLLTAAGAWAAFSYFGAPTGGGLAQFLVARFGDRAALLALLLALAGWLQIGCLSSLFLTGRNSIAALLIGLPYAAGAMVLVFHRSIPAPPLEWLSGVFHWVVAAAGVLLTVTVVVLAVRWQRMPPAPLAWGAGGLTLFAIVAATALDLTLGPRTIALFGLTVAALAPWPAATLAIGWNRHR